MLNLKVVAAVICAGSVAATSAFAMEEGKTDGKMPAGAAMSGDMKGMDTMTMEKKMEMMDMHIKMMDEAMESNDMAKMKDAMMKNKEMMMMMKKSMMMKKGGMSEGKMMDEKKDEADSTKM